MSKKLFDPWEHFDNEDEYWKDFDKENFDDDDWFDDDNLESDDNTDFDWDDSDDFD